MEETMNLGWKSIAERGCIYEFHEKDGNVKTMYW